MIRVRRCLFLLLTLAAVTTGLLGAQDKEENLAYADLLYSQKEYAKAARQYQIFIRENPSSPNAQAGWFRLGECYLQVDQIKDARTTFEHIVKTFREGPYVGSSAYRLGVLNFNVKSYENAARYFEVAASELTSKEARHQAKFYLGRSLQFIEEFDRALKLYEEVISSNPDPKTNPFHERSMLESARIHFSKNDKKKASEVFRELAETATTETIKEEAIVRGGLIAAEIGDISTSEALLARAFQFADDSPWKSLAQVGAIFNAYTREEYDRVISLYSTGSLNTTVTDYRPKMLLVVGHSYRIKGETEYASKLYSLIESKYPNTEEGSEAGYRKLQLLYQKGDGSLPSIAGQFVAKLSKSDPKSAYIDMANLMKAEFHFSEAEKGAERNDENYAKTNYRAAASAYASVREANVNEKFHPIRLYKQGWAYLEAGELQQGILAISRFIKRFPDNSFTPSALAKRGTTYQSLEDFTFALNDYEQIIKDYPDSPELEVAMQQRALIFAQKRDLPKMIKAYEGLLKRFPNTSGKAEATYWIGVGNFDLEDYGKAIEPLTSARQLNPAAFNNKASIRIILSHYQLEQIQQLTEEARRYIQAGRDEGVLTEEQKKDKRFPIPKPVLEYLGKRLAKERNHLDAEFFLDHLSTPEEPEKTSASTWKVLADCRMQTEKFDEAIKAYDFYLLQAEEAIEKGYAYLNRGRAQLALEQLEPARESARECLKLVKQGRMNAEARILLGDVSAKNGRLEEAATEYLVVSQIFEDKVITPRALTKAINVYLSLGNQAEAAKLRSQLRSKYPDYREE